MHAAIAWIVMGIYDDVSYIPSMIIIMGAILGFFKFIVSGHNGLFNADSHLVASCVENLLGKP